MKLRIDVGAVSVIGQSVTRAVGYDLPETLVPDNGSTPVTQAQTDLQWYDDGQTVHEPSGLLTVLPWFKKTRPAARWLHTLNALIVALLMLAWPWQPQVGNIAFFPLMASLVVRSATNVWLLGKPTRGPTRN